MESSKPIIFNNVDFPLPDSPTIETRSPSFMSREISSTAFTGGGPSYIFEILFNDITVFVFVFISVRLLVVLH